MSVTFVARNRLDDLRLSTLQVQLLAGALQAAEAADLDLLAPQAYVPSHVCTAWSDALFAALQDLVLIEVWDAQRAQVRPRAVVRAPVSLQRGVLRRPPPDPWVGLPPLAERTRVTQTPFGPLLLDVAGWLGTSGGCTLARG